MRGDIRRVRKPADRQPDPALRRTKDARPPASQAAGRVPKPTSGYKPPARRAPDAPRPPAVGHRRTGFRPRVALTALAVAAAVTLIGLRAQGSATEARGELAESVQVARQSLSAAQERLKAADLPGAEKEFEAAEQSLAHANRTLAQNGLIGGIAAGQGSGDIRTGQQLLTAGESAARSGRNVLAEVREIGEETANSDQGLYRSGEVLSQHMPELQDELSNLDRHLKVLGYLQQRAADSDNPELAAAGKEFAALLPQSREAVAEARRIADTLPELLGQDEFKRYLLLFQNPSELRPTGGFTGTYGRLTVDGGALKELTVDSIYNPANQAKLVVNDQAPEPLAELSGPQWLMQDANWEPDFPKTAQRYQRFYGKAGGPSADGVIAITATPILEILRVVGPIEQPDLGQTITADSFFQTVFDYQQGEATAGNDPKTLLRDFMPRLLEKIRRAPADQQQRIRQVVAAAITSKDIQLYFKDGDLQELADKAGLTGRLAAEPGLLAVVDANLGANKSSIDLATTVTRTVTIDAQGNQRTDLAVTRRHAGTSNVDPNENYTRIYVPKGASIDALNGWADKAPPNVSSEGDFTVIGGWTDVAPGEERTVTVSYRSPDALDLKSGAAPVSFWRQPGSNVRLVTEVRLPEGYAWDGQPAGTATGNVIRFDEPASSDIIRRLTFRKLP